MTKFSQRLLAEHLRDYSKIVVYNNMSLDRNMDPDIKLEKKWKKLQKKWKNK